MNIQNTLLILIAKYKQIKIHLTSLKNKNITLKHINQIKQNFKKMDWKYLSHNPNINSNFIQQNIDQYWDWNQISKNNNLTKSFIIYHHDKLNFVTLCSNPSHSFSFLKSIISELTTKYLQKQLWGCFIAGLSKNPNINLNIILQLKNEKWRWYNILQHSKHITIDLLLQFQNHINWAILSCNPHVPLNVIDFFHTKEWRWGRYGISTNHQVTPEFIQKYLLKDWHWGDNGLSRNHSLPLKFIEQNICQNWYWGGSGISVNHNLTMSFIRKYSHKKWCWYSISTNPNITMKNIIRNRKFPWKWNYISLNPNITLRFIDKYFYKLSPTYLTHNSFKYQNYLLCKKKNRQLWEVVLMKINVPWYVILMIDEYY